MYFLSTLGCSGKNMNTSQTMNKFQPYARSMPKLPKFPKFPKLKKKPKTTCHLKEKKQKTESSSSSQDENFHHLIRNLKQKHYDLLDYNISSESDDSCNEKYNKKICYPKYHRLKQVVSQDSRRKKNNQQCDDNYGNICDSKDIHHNEIQLRSTKDCCGSIRNECMQCECPENTIKYCCSSSKSDCTPCKYLQCEAKNNFKTHYNDGIACNSCCDHNESYNHLNCLRDIGSTINHYRSNNLLTNSRLLPRRYPASWTPLQGRSCSSPNKIVRNVCTIQECDDHNRSNDEFYEGSCNAIRGGVAQKSTPSYSQTSEVSFYLCNKCSDHTNLCSSNNNKVNFRKCDDLNNSLFNSLQAH